VTDQKRTASTSCRRLSVMAVEGGCRRTAEPWPENARVDSESTQQLAEQREISANQPCLKQQTSGPHRACNRFVANAEVKRSNAVGMRVDRTI